MPNRTQSPPKRMTRSRTVAVDEPTTQPKPSRTKAMAAKTAANTTKRKPRNDPEDDDELAWEDQKTIADEANETATTRTTSRAAAQKATRAIGTTVNTLNKFAAEAAAPKKARGRPAGSTNKRTTTTIKATSAKADPTARTTRARNASISEEAPDVQTKAAPAKRTAPRKKVTFVDADSEKENEVEEQSGKQRATSKASTKTGLQAKPVRGASTRGRSSASARGGRASGAPRPPPLSPKKNVQVSAPHLDEDEPEPRSASSPAKQLQKSPIKPSNSIISRSPERSNKHANPEKRQQQVDLGSSVDELQVTTGLFHSPAKRLGASISTRPVKPMVVPTWNSISSPRKPASNDTASNTPKASSGTILSKSPQKFPMSAPPQQSVFKGAEQGFSQSTMFSSPAKRPASPIKGVRFGSIIKPSTKTASLNKSLSASGMSGTPRKLFSPMKASSAFKVAKPPGSPPKVHKMTEEERARMFDDASPTETPCGTPAKTTATPVTPKQPSRIPVKSPPKSTEKAKLSNPGPWKNAQSIKSPWLKQHTSSSTTMAQRGEAYTTLRDQLDDESDDELALGSPNISSSPPKHSEATAAAFQSPFATPKLSLEVNAPDGPMTTLAKRMQGFHAASPVKQVLAERQLEETLSPQSSLVWVEASSPAPSYVESTPSRQTPTPCGDDIVIHEDEDGMDELASGDSLSRQSRISEASQDYGDENVMPIEGMLPLQPAESAEQIQTCTPAELTKEPSRVSYTVSKVPLKPAAEDQETKARPSRRGHSLAATLSPQAELELGLLRQCHPRHIDFSAQIPSTHNAQQARTSQFAEMFDDEEETAQPFTPVRAPATPSIAAATPARTPRPDLNTQLLSGAVVFVDVHTTEGADASGIFVELLTQMGARCVKHWNWNSRGSFDGTHAAGDLQEAGSSKVGITHVVFKDGGKRTMERIRESKGLVQCVGVGWVLDCEKESKWLEEANYAVDATTIPRGGNRRRKSMEPKALSSLSFSPARSVPSPAMSPTKEFLNLDTPTPTPRHVTIECPVTGIDAEAIAATPAPNTFDEDFGISTPTKQTPAASDFASECVTPTNLADFVPAENSFSPATPYFLHPSQLVQQTCPPKQTQQLFFPVTGRIQDEPNEGMRQRLLLARRKSLQWAPKVGSPLMRMHSYEK